MSENDSFQPSHPGEDSLTRVPLTRNYFREGFERFLQWLEDISEGCTVYMVSHGNADILVLDRLVVVVAN